MAMATPCGGCNEITSWICAAQYRNYDDHKIICYECFEKGYRCWFLNEELIISKKCPEGAKSASLYWDEGLFVTKGEQEIIYPETTQ